jgi:hypothetical protein
MHTRAFGNRTRPFEFFVVAIPVWAYGKAGSTISTLKGSANPDRIARFAWAVVFTSSAPTPLQMAFATASTLLQLIYRPFGRYYKERKIPCNAADRYVVSPNAA